MEISGPGLDTVRRHRPPQRVRVTEISPEDAAYPGVVQKNVFSLPQMLLAAPDGEPRLDVHSEGQARFIKKYRLKGEDCVADQTAQVHL